jgi:hypothetical protein
MSKAQRRNRRQTPTFILGLTLRSRCKSSIVNLAETLTASYRAAGVIGAVYGQARVGLASGGARPTGKLRRIVPSHLGPEAAARRHSDRRARLSRRRI